MGADGFLVASALRGIIAQRLLRKICTYCIASAAPDLGEQMFLQHMARMLGEHEITHAYHRGEGCPQCHNTGYFGRVGAYELLAMTPAMADALHRRDAALFTRAAKQAPGFKPLVQTALDYARAGTTSIEEVMRIADSIEDEPELSGNPTRGAI
jgi:MSHA biogenesis protein MshE